VAYFWKTNALPDSQPTASKHWQVGWLGFDGIFSIKMKNKVFKHIYFG